MRRYILKKSILFICALSVFMSCLFIGCNAQSGRRIALSPTGDNDTKNLRNAINSLKNGDELHLEEGIYYIDEPIKIADKENIKIYSDNAKIVRTGIEFDGTSAKDCYVFVLHDSDSVTLSGLTISYDYITSLSGVVTISDANNGEVYIKPNDIYKPTGDEVYCALNTFDKDGNPDMKLEKYNNNGFETTLLKNGTIKLSGLDYYEAGLLNDGTIVGLRAFLSSDGVIQVSSCNNIEFEKITVHNSFSGVFFVNGRTNNLTLKQVDISPENESSLFSSNADGLHIASMGGRLTVDDCNFVKLGDDCVNVHGMAYTVTGLSGNTFKAYNERYKVFAMSDWANVGDEIEFYDKKSFKLLGTAKLKKFSLVGGKMTFDSLPEGVENGDIISNKTLHPSVEINNCNVDSNRARAFLIQTEDVVIKNCEIKNTRLAAILISPDINYWYEMSPGRKIKITSNTITNCGIGAGAAIVTAVSHDRVVEYPSDVNRDISITKNTFNNCPTALKAASVTGLSFTENILNGIGTPDFEYAVITNRCEDVNIGENSLNNCTVELYKH